MPSVGFNRALPGAVCSQIFSCKQKMATNCSEWRSTSSFAHVYKELHENSYVVVVILEFAPENYRCVRSATTIVTRYFFFTHN